MDIKVKIWILAILAAIILVVYAVPTFYDAGTQKKVIKVARIMAEDIMYARSHSLSSSDNYGIRLIRTGRQGYAIFSGDKVIKTVYLDQTDPTVVYSSLFDTNDTFIFKAVRDISEVSAKDHDSIFFNALASENKKVLKNIIRLYIDKNTYNIKLFRVYEIKENGDMVFKEI